MRTERLIKKIISAVTILAFTVTNVFYQQPTAAYASQLPSSSKIKKHSAVLKNLTEKSTQNQFGIFLPKELGDIEAFYQGTSPKLMVYIQDAHSSLEAQQNIAKIIRELVRVNRFNIVFEEGYEGPVPSDEYFDIKDPKIKAATAFFFMDHLRLGGAEFAHINRRQDFSLIGIDRLNLFLENTKEYQKAHEVSSFVKQDIDELAKNLSVLETSLFPPEFQKWWRLENRFQTGEIQIPDYVYRTLQFFNASEMIPAENKAGLPKRYPALMLLAQLYESGFKKSERKIPESEIETMKIVALFRELEQLEEEIAEIYLKSIEARKLLFYLETLGTLRKMSRLEASREIYDRLGRRIARFRTREILGFIQAHSDTPVVLSEMWEKEIRRMIRFYRLALEREDSVRTALRGNWDRAALVFGGFHKQGILQMLREEGISYLVINPRITQEDPIHEGRYRDLMSGKIYSFEEHLWQKESVFVAPANEVHGSLGKIIQAARVPSLYVAEEGPAKDLILDFCGRIARSELRKLPDQESPQNAAPESGSESTGVDSEAAASLFSSARDWLDSLDRLDRLLALVGDNASFKIEIVRLYHDYLKNLSGFHHYDRFLTKLFKIIEEREPVEYLRQEMMLTILSGIMKNPRADHSALRETLQNAKTFPASMRPILKIVFKEYRWGRSPHEYFLYRDVPWVPFEQAFPKIESLTTDQVFRKLQMLFAAMTGAMLSGEEFAWFAQRTVGAGEARNFSKENWRRIYEALAAEHQFIQETRLGGFRRVQGKRHFAGSPSPLRLWRPGKSEVITRIAKVFGITEDELKQIVQQVLGTFRSAESLSAREWLLIHRRLDDANKQSFSRLDYHRYGKQKGLLKRLLSKPGAYVNVFKEDGSLALVFALVNDFISIVLGVFVRFPIRFFEMFMLRYYRTEILYEHFHSHEDFLGPAKSRILLRKALTDIRENKKTFRDRVQASPAGFLNRAMNKSLAGSLVKATWSFLTRRFYLAVISAASMGVLALLGVGVLSSGFVLSTAVLVPMTSGIVGLGSIAASLNSVPIINHLVVSLTVGHVGQSLIIAVALLIPSTFIQKYQHAKSLKPDRSRILLAIRVALRDILISPNFWKQVILTAIALILIGPEISAILQYAVALDLAFFGSPDTDTTVEVLNEEMTAFWKASIGENGTQLFESLLTGKVDVEGLPQNLEGSLFTRFAGFVEHDALSWGHQLLDSAQNHLGFNLSDWTFHHLGGDPAVKAHQVWLLADAFARARVTITQREISDEAAERFEAMAQIMTSRMHHNQVFSAAVADQLLHMPFQDSVEILERLNLEDIGTLARDYAKSQYQGQALQITAMGELLRNVSYEKYVAFRLAYLAGAVLHTDTAENRGAFVKSFQAFAKSDSTGSREVLGAMATVLDDLPPETMAALLSQAGCQEVVGKILDEALWVHVTRKERLIILREKLGLGAAREGSKITEYRSPGEKNSPAAAALIDTGWLSKPLQLDQSLGIVESTDQISALLQYWNSSHDPRVIESLAARYAWLASLQNENGSFMTGRSFGMKVLPDSVQANHLSVTAEPSGAVSVTDAGISARLGYTQQFVSGTRDGKEIQFEPQYANVEEISGQAGAQIVREAKDPLGQARFIQTEKIAEGRYVIRHGSTAEILQPGDYIFRYRFDWKASREDHAEAQKKEARIWFPVSGDMIDINQPKGPQMIDVTELLRANQMLVFYGENKGMVLKLLDFPQQIKKIWVATKPAGERRVIDGINFEFHYPKLKPGERVSLPQIDGAPFWVPLVSAPKNLGGDGDAVPDDLQAILPLWLQMLQSQSGDHRIYQTDEGYAAAGRTLFECARFFARAGEEAKSRGQMETYESYLRLSLQAKERGLRTAEYAYRTYRSLLHQENAVRAYANGLNYPEMIQLFDEAYEMTGDEKWYEAEKHVAKNIIQNKIIPERKLLPRYAERQIQRPYIVLNGKEIDLFQAIRNGHEGFNFAITEREKAPAFEVGDNEELGGTVRESNLELIRTVVVTDQKGRPVDQLTFRYLPKGILGTIESVQGKIILKSQTRTMVDTVTVYHLDYKTRIPYGVNYRYVYNPMGELEYIVKEYRITIEDNLERHPVHNILKDFNGRPLKDIDIPRGFRPEYGFFRGDEALDSRMQFDAVGRTLSALHRVWSRAESEGDWILAASAQNAAFTAVRSFYDDRGRILLDSEGRFRLYSSIDPESGEVKIITADANAQANILLGLAPWTGVQGLARELYKKGKEFFVNHPAAENSEIQTILALSEAMPSSAPQPQVLSDVINQSLQSQAVKELQRYIRYGQDTANFKFADVKIRRLRLEQDRADAVFLNWDPVPMAQWYLVREYRQDANGDWVFVKRNDRWVSTNSLSVEDPTGTPKRYVVVAFTADPIFESYGPYHGAKTFPSEPVDAHPQASPASPGKPYLILGKRHLVGDHEEWVDLGEEFTLVAKEFKHYPHAKGAEWEIATDREFKNVVKKFSTEEEIPKIYLRGLPDGDYYVRLRFWSGQRETHGHDWFTADPVTVTKKAVPEQVTQEDDNTNGIQDPGEIDHNQNGYFDAIRVRDKTVIAWTPTGSAKFYSVSIWYQEGDLGRFHKSGIVTTNPFVNVREFTAHPVNRIEIIPYTADPLLGGISGSSSGLIAIPEIPGIHVAAEVTGIEILTGKETPTVRWQPVPGANVYSIETMYRSVNDEEQVEEFLSPMFATHFTLQKGAKFVRVRAWTDQPARGGEVLTEYSPWVKIDAELKQPESVKPESVRVMEAVRPSGRKIFNLTFEPVKEAAGYWVHAKNKRGGANVYWVPQPAGDRLPEMTFESDADTVTIQATSDKFGGRLSEVTEANVSVDLAGDNLVPPFKIQEQKYFFYDLTQIPADGMRVYIQYATQFGNTEIQEYGLNAGNYMIPTKNADRVRARIVKISEDGDRIVSDWSDWQEVKVRVDLPPTVTAITQIKSREGTGRMLIAGVGVKESPENVIAGFEWETRVDFNDAHDEAVHYATRAKYSDGKMYERGDHLHVSRPARFVRAKAVYHTPYGDVESREWSPWIPVQVDFKTPAAVENIRLSGKSRVVFDAHRDPLVNAYLIELTDNPDDALMPRHSYTRRIIREGEQVVRPNNFFTVPLRAKYVRVTPVIQKDDDDRILGVTSAWVPIEVKDISLLPRMQEPTHYGRLIMSRSVDGANLYKIETQDRFGTVTSVVSRSPFMNARREFVAYRVQPLKGDFREGEFVMDAEGEWTPWRYVPEVKVPTAPPVPPHFMTLSIDGVIVLRWDDELFDEKGIYKYNYEVEFEDQMGNRFQSGMLYARVCEVPFHAVRARVKALKGTLGPQKLFPEIDSESDWSPWLEIHNTLPTLPSVEVESITEDAGYFVIKIKPLPGAQFYYLEYLSTDGTYHSVFHRAERMEENGWTLKFKKNERVPMVMFRMMGARATDQKLYGTTFYLKSPPYDHRWIDLPGKKLLHLETPKRTAFGWEAAKPIIPGFGVFYRVFGYNGEGEVFWYHRSETPPAPAGQAEKYPFMAIQAVEALNEDDAFGHESAISDFIAVNPLPASGPVSAKPVPVEVTANQMITWPKVNYEITIRENDAPEKSPVVIVSRGAFPPDELIPRGRDAYTIQIERITGFEISMTNEAGQEKVIGLGNDHFAFNISSLPEGRYEKIRVRYLTGGEFLGTHSEWSDPKAVRMNHSEEVQLLSIRPTSENILTAVFSDGVEADFSRADKKLVRVLMPGGGDIDLKKVPSRYRLDPEEVYARGEQWKEVTPEDNYERAFYGRHYGMRRVTQNKNWVVTVPSDFTDRPSALLGVSTAGVFHLSSKQGQALQLGDGNFQMTHQPYMGNNPGVVEAQWTSGKTGLDLYTRKYIAGEAQAAVYELSVNSWDENYSGQNFTLALKINPRLSRGLVRVKEFGNYRVIHFATGEFVAIHKDRLAGWYLGADADRAMQLPAMMNGRTEFEGSGEGSVIYLSGQTGETHLDRSKNIFLFSGEAANDEELSRTLNAVIQDARTYEQAWASFVKHASRDGVLPREFMDLYYLQVLQNRAWNRERGTYWEMLGSENPEAARNTLSTNASWTGNSALMQQLNVSAYPLLMQTAGHDAVNPAGEGLLEQRIIPNAGWIMSMQTPADSFYMKTGDAMRFYLSEGTVLMDNMQLSAMISSPHGVVLKRGYEPLDAFTIAGCGFGIQPGTGQTIAQHNLHDPKMFSFSLPLPDGMIVDPAQSELKFSRTFQHHDGLFHAQENLTLRKGEYALRYSLALEAKEALHLDHVSVAMSRLDADQDISRNPDMLPGFPGENGLVIAGVDEVFRARDLFESQGLTKGEKGAWIDLLSLFTREGQLSMQGRAIRDALKKVGAIGVLGWDKEGLMYLKEGIDYDRGFRVMVKIDEREDDTDQDHLLEFTDVRIDIPVAAERQAMKPGERYESAQVYFTNFWVRLGVTDPSGIPEDLKHMNFDWIHNIDREVGNGLSMESDYAFTESAIALWDTANLMLDKMLEASAQKNEQEFLRFRSLAARYALSAMRATVSARDADHSSYDPETGLVRDDIMNNKGVMRFYGTFAVTYAKARDFLIRLKDFETQGTEFSIFGNSEDGAPISIYDAEIKEAETAAANYRAQMEAAQDAKAYAHAKAYWEIYLAKAAKFKVLKHASDLIALEAFVAESDQTSEGEQNPAALMEKKFLRFYAGKQITYLKALLKFPGEKDQGPGSDYWLREILFNADKILRLQEKNVQCANYGGFYQSEQPSKAQLDDNGTKLWALRVAYEVVSGQIDQLLKTPGARVVDLVRLHELYGRQQSYLEAARLNIGTWVKIDERDHHLYGWESRDRAEDYDSQRTPYGNETYRLRGLASWMDILPEARVTFDRSSAQHTAERPDGRRMWSPRGIKMNVSYDPPADGNDTSTEIMPTALMSFIERSRGGSFNERPPAVKLASEEEEGPPVLIQKNPFPHRSFLTSGWAGLAAVFQWLVEVTLIKDLLGWVLQKVIKISGYFARKITANRFVFYNLTIITITAALVTGMVYLFNMDKTSWIALVLMAAASTYAFKNVAETLVRYFRLGMIVDKPLPAAHESSNVRLDAAPFRYGPKHLQTVLSVPLYTTGDDAYISHGTADETRGAFHNMVMKNMTAGHERLVFHINDQSPEPKDSNGFNPRVFHETYVREMAARYPEQSFFYIHQSGNTDKKFGAVQLMDIWWYALKDNIREIIDEVWDRLSPAQQRNLKKEVYGITEWLPVPVLQGSEVFTFLESDLVMRIHPDQTADLTFQKQYQSNVFLFEGLELPRESGDEILVELKVPRQDGLTAVMPVAIRKEGNRYAIYHYNENPEGGSVLIEEVLEGKTQARVGLLRHEKDAMIEEEARAVLYSLWAAAYGGSETAGDDLAHGNLVTSGRSMALSPSEVARLQNVLRTGGSDAEAIFIRSGLAARLSRVMISQTTDYFEKVADVIVRDGMNLQRIAAQKGRTAADLFPPAFDAGVEAWTDAEMLSPEEAAEGTVPFELEVGKRAVPGKYYRLNAAGDGLEIDDNPALNIIDETTRALETIREDASLNAYEKKTRARRYLEKANQVLKNIIELMPVKINFQVRYNPEHARTEIIEERWIMYQYVNADGSTAVFFKPERIIRCDNVIGHLPSIGPVAYQWRMDNDNTADLKTGDEGTIAAGPLMAGHPRYQPVSDPSSGRTVMGYGGMVLPLMVGNADASLWTEVASRNRRKSTWDLRHQWLGFEEAQYTGSGIENLDSAARAKAFMMAKGFYMSHDMREAGELGGNLSSLDLLRDLRTRGLFGAFLEGRSHSKFPELAAYVRLNFISGKNPDKVIFRKYGREMPLNDFLELLALGARSGGMGLLDGFAGEEEWFENLEQEWEKVMGVWKRGDNQWAHDGMGGLDVRGVARLPGMAPGFTTSPRRNLEQTVTVLDGNIYRLFLGQQYRENPLTDVQKYFITRTFEEDQRGAVMFLWIAASLILAALNGGMYTFLNIPIFSYLFFFLSIVIIVGIMKFGPITKDIKREGLTSRNAVAIRFAVTDTLIESVMVSGLNLWRALVSTCQLIFRAPVMKWLTRAQLKNKKGLYSFFVTYSIGILLGFSMAYFVMILHPTWSWVIFGSLFLLSLILGPVFSRISAMPPAKARVYLRGITVLMIVLAISGYAVSFYVPIGALIPLKDLLLAGIWVGKISLGLLVAYAVIQLILKSISSAARRMIALARDSGFGITTFWKWGIGFLSLTLRLDFPFALNYAIKKNFRALGQLNQRLTLVALKNYFITKGIDSTDYLPNRDKAFANLVVVLSLWLLPLLFPHGFLVLAGGNAAIHVILAACYLGMFFPVGFWILDHILSPQRITHFYNPVDWLRAFFHMTTGIFAVLFASLKAFLSMLVDLVKTPYYYAAVTRFVRSDQGDFSTEKSKRLVREAGVALKYAPRTFRIRMLQELAASPSAHEKYAALVHSGLLDHKILEGMPETILRHEPARESKMARSESRNLPERDSAEYLSLKLVSSSEQKEQTADDLYFNIVRAIRAMRGGIAIDARSLAAFSPRQREELLKLAVSGRAEVVIFYKGKADMRALKDFQHVNHIRLISEGIEKAGMLLSRFGKIALVFSETADPRAEIRRGGRSLNNRRIQLFKQLEGPEDGILTAALLKIQYENAFNIFKEENGVYVLANRKLLHMFQEYLSQELISQSA